MMKQAWNGRKQSCKTWCLACNFFSICKILPHKKRKKKKKKIIAIRKSFFPCKWSVFLFSRKFFTRNSSQKLLFAKVFVKNFAIFWSRESFCSRMFLPLTFEGIFFLFFFLLLLIYLKLTIKKFASSKFIAIVIKLINVN